MARFFWIKEALKTLRSLGVNAGMSDKDYIKKVIEINGNDSNNIKEHSILLNPGSINCSNLGTRYIKCDLNKLKKEGKTLFKEFFFEDEKEPLNFTITAMSVSPSNELKIACKECYFRERIISLINEIKHAKLEITIKSPSESTQSLFLVGINTKDNSKKALCIQSENKPYLISYQGEDLFFVSLKKLADMVKSENFPSHLDKDGLLIDVNNEINELLDPKAVVSVVDVDHLYYLDERNTLISLKLKYSRSISDAFKLSVEFNKAIENVRELILKKKVNQEKHNKNKIDKDKPNEAVFVLNLKAPKALIIILLLIFCIYIIFKIYKTNEV